MNNFKWEIKGEKIIFYCSKCREETDEWVFLEEEKGAFCEECAEMISAKVIDYNG